MAKEKKDEKNDAEKLTPEEKLFRAIVRDQKEEEEDEFFTDGTQEGGVGTETERDDEMDGSMFDWLRDMLKSIPSSLKDFLPSSDKKQKSSKTTSTKQPLWLLKFADLIQIRAINKIMVALVVALVIYFFADLIFGVFKPVSVIAQSGAIGTSREIGLMPKFPDGGIRPLAYYLTSDDKKNAFFKPVPVITDATEEVEEVVVVVEPPKVYNLVGISWDAEEYVAMLQEEEVGHALFVRDGDVMEGGVKVKEVTEFSVTLSQNGQQWEIK